MGEQEPRREVIQRGDLFYLYHPGTEAVFSGYGLAAQDGRREHLFGLLMVDRPHPAGPAWLQRIADTFGECRLVVMTANGDRGLLCQMVVSPESVPHLTRFPGGQSASIGQALQPLLEEPPAPVLRLQWDEETRLWRSELARPNKLPAEVREVFERTGYGCLALESSIGVVHVCHAADADIAGFVDAPITYRWELIKMPTAPLIRLALHIHDRPDNPYQFESFLNVAVADQAQVLADLAGQDRLYLPFYGDNLTYRLARTVPHDEQQWQRLDAIIAEAEAYWLGLPNEEYDFDQAKAVFMHQFV